MRLHAPLLVLGLAISFPAFSQVNFVAPKALEDRSPAQILKADFNGDGVPDLITIDIGAVTLFLGESHGRFRAPQVVATGSGVLAALGDFNKDGKLDIAVLNFALGNQPSSFFVLLGNGDGTFQQTATVATGVDNAAILVADYTGDGQPDVAVVGQAIQVFPGLGNGSFGSPQSTPLPVLPFTAVTGEFSADRKLDIVVGDTFDSLLYVYAGNGDGTFRLASTIAVGGPTWSLTAGDLNGDRRPDLIAAHDQAVDVVINNGNGKFAQPVTYAVAGYSTHSAVADVNLDGKPDLLVACNGVSVLFGNGDGTFQSPITTFFGVEPFTVIAGDFNGDGRTDVAFTEEFTAEWAAGDGTGNFTTAPQLPGIGYASALFIGNFLGTANADVVALDGSVSVYPGEGGGTFGGRTDIPVNYFIPSLGAKGDFNNDGIPDVVAAGSHNVKGGAPYGLQTFLGQHGTALTGGPAYGSLNFVAKSMASADFNNDGNADLVIASSNPAAYVIATGDGHGGFQFSAPVSLPAPPSSVDVADFNNDGNPDFAVTASNNVLVLLSRGDGTFHLATIIQFGGVTALATGDANADGKPDILVLTGQSVCVLLGAGTGSFTQAGCSAVGDLPLRLVTADFDGDGHLDAATVNYNGDAVSVLLGRGNGTFKPAVSFGAGSFPFDLAAGDLNGDGLPDIAAASQSSGSLSVLFNRTKR